MILPAQRPVHFTVSILMAILFLLCIVVQYNDPDVLLWISIYAVGLALTILHLSEKASRALLFVMSLSGLCGAVYLALSIQDLELDKLFSSLNMQGRGVEEIREAIGLLLQSLWLAYLAAVVNKEK